MALRSFLNHLDHDPAAVKLADEGGSAFVSQSLRAYVIAALADRDVRHADLLELELEEPVDAVFSTATFHWIADHDRLFARLRGALKPGGRLVAQCGGEGNIAELAEAAARVGEREPALAGWDGPWHFASPSDTEARLRRLGWVDVWAWPTTIRVELDDPREYLGTVALGSHLERLPADRREPFVDAVIAELDEPIVEYVRLNILARRPA